jgi:hypothetical protein
VIHIQFINKQCSTTFQRISSLLTHGYYDYIALPVRPLLRHRCRERNLSIRAQALHCVKAKRRYETYFYFFLLLPLWSRGLIYQFLDYSQTVGLLGRVISSSQGLYLNTGQHKHRKTHTHINHPWPEWIRTHDPSLPSERRQYMP